MQGLVRASLSDSVRAGRVTCSFRIVSAIRVALGLSLVVIAAAACGIASSSLTPSGSVTTLMAGWERHFKLDWMAEPEPGGARRISGYVYNQHGESATMVRLLAQALDPSGAVIGQRIAWVPGNVVGFGRAFFEVPHLPPADHYRVTIWDYTFLQSDGDRT
jgi:hypothetical protein